MDVKDKRLWRKALAKSHPDAGGDEEVFKFLNEVREHLCKEAEAPVPRVPRPPRYGPVVFRYPGNAATFTMQF